MSVACVMSIIGGFPLKAFPLFDNMGEVSSGVGSRKLVNESMLSIGDGRNICMMGGIDSHDSIEPIWCIVLCALLGKSLLTLEAMRRPWCGKATRSKKLYT